MQLVKLSIYTRGRCRARVIKVINRFCDRMATPALSRLSTDPPPIQKIAVLLLEPQPANHLSRDLAHNVFTSC